MFESFLSPSDKDAVFLHHDLVNDEPKIRLAKLRIAVAQAFTDEARELIENVVSNGSVWLSELAELAAGELPDSRSLQADSIDFFADAATLVANLGVAVMLYRWRAGDANMQSVWLCTRNDVIANVPVLAAALGIFGTGTRWPDLFVASIMATLSLTAGWKIIRLALAEMTNSRAVVHTPV